MEEYPRPLFDLLLLRPEKNRVIGSIHVPDAAGEHYGRVVAAGPGRWEFGVFIENPVKVGDLVTLNCPPQDIGSVLWGTEKLALVKARHVGCVIPPTRDVEKPREEPAALVVQ